MAKSKSQRMKEYRARKKASLGNVWLQMETQRVKKYYIPTADLDKKQKSERRLRIRKNVQKFRLKNIQPDSPLNDSIHSSRPTIILEDENSVSSTSNIPVTATPLIVKLPSYQTSGKKRSQRALSKAYKNLHDATEKVKTLKRKLKSSQKQLQRTKKRKVTDTPRGKINTLLKEAGFSPRKTDSKIKKKLLFSECIVDEVKRSQMKNPNKKNIISKVISGKIIKKYKLQSFLRKMTGITWRHISEDKNLVEIKRARISHASMIKSFLERDDNSRLMPGKQDCVSVKSGKVQKRILNDYLHNLFLKFQSEFNDNKIVYSTFTRHRPKNIILVNFTSRNTCLCSKHQNFALKMKYLKSVGIITSLSPDKFVKEHKDENIMDILNKITSEVVNYQEWRKVETPDGRQRLRIVDVTVNRDEFIETMVSSFEAFKGHVERVSNQYCAIRTMKEDLPVNHLIVHMDFAENYSCQNMEEIQSAYWSTTMVTLHPVVLYYRDSNGSVEHKSMVFVSDVMQHNTSMVQAIITRLMELIKEVCPLATNIHFWTDSPTSQYRNKTIFDLISRFKTAFGLIASWHYFEVGHGKGACDGVGGTAKRNADMAVKLGTVVIQDASDFFAWAISDQNSKIQYIFINQDEYEASKMVIEERTKLIKAVKGTMVIHCVLGTAEEGVIYSRKTSCGCNLCFENECFNFKSPCDYQRQYLLAQPNKAVTGNQEPGLPEPTLFMPTEHGPIKVNDYVVALYEGKKYIGQVIDMDEDDYEITFMMKSGKFGSSVKWPASPDIIHVKTSDVLFKTDPPEPTGKSKRVFTISQFVINQLEV